MLLQTIDEEIRQAKRILENWGLYAAQIAEVRRLERGTMYTPPVERDQGYYALPAVQGYQQIINAYQLLGNVTPAQSEKLDKVSAVLGGLQADETLLGDNPDPATMRRYALGKLDELRDNGETYMLSGHARHFNITRITKLPDGGYSYTLYDAGHESNVLGWKGDRPIIHAVRESRLKDGTNLQELIEADVFKKGADADTPEYKQKREAIRAALEEPPLRTEMEYGQRKGNCTTRGQRIMAADILKEPRLSESLYDFASSAGGTSTAEIKRMLELKVERLELLQAEGAGAGVKTWAGMSVPAFMKAADTENYEPGLIPLDAGGSMMAYRTKPGVFPPEELDLLLGTLQRNGVRAAVRESMTKPGQHYLYVPVEDYKRVADALARDASPAAELYRQYGPRAQTYVEVRDFVKMADPANYGHANIGAPGGGLMEAYRTVPGRFDQAELGLLQEKLARQSLPATIRESTSQPGLFYLYVPFAQAARVEAALLHDDSPAATMYRHFGAKAADQVVPVDQPLTGPLGFIADAAKWQAARLENGSPTTRLPTRGLKEPDIRALENEMVRNGLRPLRAESQTLGPVLRLEGDDVARFQGWQENLIASRRKKTEEPEPAPPPGGLVAQWTRAALRGFTQAPADTPTLIRDIQRALNVTVTGAWTPDTNKALERLIVCAQMTPEYIKESKARGGRGEINGQYDAATHKGLKAMAAAGAVEKSLIKAIDRVNAGRHMNDLYHGPLDFQQTLSEINLSRAIFNLGPPPQQARAVPAAPKAGPGR